MEEEILKEKTLLVVDDENDLRDIIAGELEFMGAKVFQAENISNAQAVLAQHKIDLIVSDIRMPGGTGIDLLNIVKARNTNVPPIILVTGFADITTEDAFHKGAEALVNKPFRLDDLIKMVVRFTSPISSRFREENVAIRTIEPDPLALSIGRGGFSTKIKIEGRKIDIGEVVKFNFQYHGKAIIGEGACRWLKPTDKAPHEAFIGVEFMSLADETFNELKDIFEHTSSAPYIPAFKN